MISSLAVTRQHSPALLLRDPVLGRIWMPQKLVRAVSLPGRPARTPNPHEYGIIVAYARRPVLRADGFLKRMELLWHEIGFNERVDQGAVQQDIACFGAGVSNTFVNVAVMNANTPAVAKNHLSLLSTSAGVSTNEYTGNGLARAAGAISGYTAPTTLGNTFQRTISKTFTVSSGTPTAYGSGLFDSLTVATANLWAEFIWTTTAGPMAVNDTLQSVWVVAN